MIDRNAQAALVQQALGRRLRAAGAVLMDEPLPPVATEAAFEAAELLNHVVRSVHERPTPERIWLLIVAVSADYPDQTVLEAAVREFELIDAIDAQSWLLQYCVDLGHSLESLCRELEVIEGGVVVDVDQVARNNHHTGIQEVIRQTMPHWAKSHDPRFSTWTDDYRALRGLTDSELARVIDWHGRPDDRKDPAQRQDQSTIIAPWRSVLVVTDIDEPISLRKIAALGSGTDTRVVTIGYDCIPVVSADLSPATATTRTAHYLSMVKQAKRVGAISSSAFVEFSGFVEMLPAQGLTGPTVVECQLPSAGATRTRESAATDSLPLVLCVGSLEPRKNHLALLQAAETLWREGAQFELMIVGGSVWNDELIARIAELEQSGRAITVGLRIPALELAAAYQRARFTVFASLHEGYGLPVAESLAAGVPIITSNFGSTAEIGAEGGTILIDPRDDQALIDAMRTLLTDDEELDRLRADIARRPSRGWDDYAADLWAGIVSPEIEVRLA